MVSTFFFVVYINFCHKLLPLNTRVVVCNEKNISVEEFNKLKKLKYTLYADLSNTNFNELCKIINMRELESLSIKSTKVRNLNCLEKFPKLKYLNIKDNKLNNFENLRKIKNEMVLDVNVGYINSIVNILKDKYNIILKFDRNNFYNEKLFRIYRNLYVIDTADEEFKALVKLKYEYYISPVVLFKNKSVFYLLENINDKLYFYMLEYLLKNSFYLIFSTDANNKTVYDYLKIKIQDKSFLYSNELLELYEYLNNRKRYYKQYILNLIEFIKSVKIVKLFIRILG